jgi:hypothetical protein
MTPGHISVTTTWAMLREEHAWNASVPQGVQLSNLVLLIGILIYI